MINQLLKTMLQALQGESNLAKYILRLLVTFHPLYFRTANQNLQFSLLSGLKYVLVAAAVMVDARSFR